MKLEAKDGSDFRAGGDELWAALQEKIARYRDNYASAEENLPAGQRTVFEITDEQPGSSLAFRLRNSRIELTWSCRLVPRESGRIRAVFRETLRFRARDFFLVALSGLNPRNELGSLVQELHAELDGRVRPGWVRSMF